MVPRHGGLLARWRATQPATLPAWLTEADVDFYAGEFARTGFRGGLNWYRNIDRNWELLAPSPARGYRAGAVHRRRPRPGGGLPGHGPADPQPDEIRAGTPREDHAAGLRPLDPAGAAARSTPR